ncbi:unnamed protein product [Dovyalis caffra]|uniref:Uncharacterized protein n=1 Tax=Dovyalis caffra TaxID=77055 RepID=A0AAV1SSV5_9ROSI|nr:unnamed protein product [Dovyalis caffra]
MIRSGHTLYSYDHNSVANYLAIHLFHYTTRRTSVEDLQNLHPHHLILTNIFEDND